MILGTQDAIEFYKAGDVKKALKIASSYKMGFSTEEKGTIQKGFDAFNHADFYKQLGKNPEAMIKKACKLFEDKIVKGL